MINNFNLMLWLATGKGLAKSGNRVYHMMECDETLLFEPIKDDIMIRTWYDTEWHVPTLDYMDMRVRGL